MAAAEPAPRPEPIPGVALPGPYPVGDYALALRERLRSFTRVQVFGEVWNLRVARARVYFELRDARGALPCSMWRDRFESLGAHAERLADGALLVVAGGCDYYPGSSTSSPSFGFDASALRIAGEGDLLAQVERLRRKLDAEGLLTLQRQLPRPGLPRTIGVVTGEGGKARDDVVAALRRRGWEGRLVWAFAPVQDRHAAPRIAAALRDLAAVPEVEVVIVARGGGSLADLFAFCDEALCRTVALLRVPVISSVGHHTDRTLIDDVAAAACSTPTHAAAEAVRIDCLAARAELARCGARLERHARNAIVVRARALRGLARAPADHVARERRRLHQQLRELRASARRRVTEERSTGRIRLLVLQRKAAAAAPERERLRRDLERRAAALASAAEAPARRRRELDALALALAAHDPARTLERGYALVERRAGGELVTSAADARAAHELALRFADGVVPARIEEQQ